MSAVHLWFFKENVICNQIHVLNSWLTINITSENVPNESITYFQNVNLLKGRRRAGGTFPIYFLGSCITHYSGVCLASKNTGTESLCLANLTFRFVIMQSIRSFASAICSAYKWTHPHLVEFQYTEKIFFFQKL